jgi:hypothetical protein
LWLAGVQEDEMRKIAIPLFLILLFPTFALAGQIFGSLKQNGASIGKGTAVLIKCSESEKYEGQTDGYGSYNIYVPRAGKCGFTVYYGGRWSPAYFVYSDQTDPVRYDFELVRQPDGSFKLERK